MSKSDSERGAALVTFALWLMLFLACLALAIDVGVAYVERRRVQAVADAAALAAVQVMTDNGTDSQILAAIHDYVQVYNPLAASESRDYSAVWLQGKDSVGSVGAGARPTGVTGILVTVRGHVPTLIANLFGITEFSSAAQGGGGYSPLDVVLVLDKSGSMNDDSCMFHGVISADNNVRDYIIGGHCDPNHNNSQVTHNYGGGDSECTNCLGSWNPITPTRTPTPRPGPTRTPAPGPTPTPNPAPLGYCTWPDGTRMSVAPPPAVCGAVDYSVGACQTCRGVWTTPEQPIDALKTAANLFVSLVQAQLMPTSPRLGLATYATNASLDQSLTYDFSSMKSRISAITAPDNGNTNCQGGLYQARTNLASIGRWTAVKVILFMSDGICNEHSSGSSCTSGTDAQRAICEAGLAKAQGFIVFTIGLGTGAEEATLKAISSDPVNNYLYAPTGANLSAAFAAMFQKIKRLRLVQ